MLYLMLFVEGILTFLSPCLLPMIPLYLSYFAAQDSQADKGKILQAANLFVLAFSLVFMAMSLLANYVGQFFISNQNLINIVAGLIIIGLGLDQLWGHRFSSRLFARSTSQQGQPKSALGLGFLFALTWTPCVGIYVASALSLAMTANNYGQSLLMLVAYCLGLGIPFILSALLIQESKRSIKRIAPYLPILEKFSAILLIVFGILMATGKISSWLGL